MHHPGEVTRCLHHTVVMRVELSCDKQSNWSSEKVIIVW